MSRDESMSHFDREMQTGAARALGCIVTVIALLVGGCVVKFVLDDMSDRPRAYFPSSEPEDRPLPEPVIQRHTDPPPLPVFAPKDREPEPRKPKLGPPPSVISPRDGKAAKNP
jgi:hypothetical protein